MTPLQSRRTVSTWSLHRTLGRFAAPGSAIDGEPFKQYTPQPSPRYLQTDKGYQEVTPGRGGAPPLVRPVPAPGGGTL